MKLIIDIPEDDYNYAKQQVADGIANPLKIYISNGIPIPDNDCNNCEKAWTDECERAECYENNYKHWTPYQKGSK